MSGEPRFLAIYRWRVAAVDEAAFVERWRRATEGLVALGGMGSLLGRAETGELVAVALWPSAEAREQAFATIGGVEPEWPPTERLEPLLIEPIANLWELGQGRRGLGSSPG